MRMKKLIYTANSFTCTVYIKDCDIDWFVSELKKKYQNVEVTIQ